MRRHATRSPPVRRGPGRQAGTSPAALALDLAGDHALDVLIAEDVSVREAIGASYRAVSPEARTALSLLAVNLPGEISPQELADAAQGNASVLDQLAAVGLLSASRTSHGTECYKMHALVRAYGVRQQKQEAAEYEPRRPRPPDLYRSLGVASRVDLPLP